MLLFVGVLWAVTVGAVDVCAVTAGTYALGAVGADGIYGAVGAYGVETLDGVYGVPVTT